MKRLFVLVVAGLVLLAASCDTKNIGTEPPTRGPVPTIGTVPADMFGAQDATWTCTWTGGDAPYTITWAFGGGAADVGPIAAASPDTQVATMINASQTDAANYTLTVTVTDALGMSGTDTAAYIVGPLQNQPPTITNATFAAGVLTVDVEDLDGDAVTVNVTVDAGLVVDAASKPAAQAFTGTATFNISAEDFFNGATGQAHATANDGSADSAVSDVNVTIDPITLAADTIYAIPMVTGAATGEAVTIVVATGNIDNFQFLNGAGVCVEDDATYVAQSFNAGAVGGLAADIDGAWTTMNPSTGFLLPPDTLIQSTDIGGGRERWDFNLTPIGGSDQAGFNGAIFNFQFDFTVAGTKTLGFQEVLGVNRTYFSDGASTEYFWGTLHADENGTLNDTSVGNTINVS